MTATDQAKPSPPPADTPLADTPATPVNAGVLRRLTAMVYDGLLLFAVLFIATLIPALIISPEHLENAPHTNAVVHELNRPLDGWLFRLYLLAVIILFNGLFWRRQGQTLGMQAWRLKLVSKDGGRPSWGQCAIRVLGSLLSLSCGGLGYFWIWIDRQGLSWHDRLSGTRVLLLPKTKKP